MLDNQNFDFTVVQPKDYFFLIFIGGFFGGVARYFFGEFFPGSTDGIYSLLAINLFGVFLLALTNKIKPVALKQFFHTGVLGGFTSFSTFIMITVENLNWIEKILNIILSIGGGLLIIFLIEKLTPFYQQFVEDGKE